MQVLGGCTAPNSRLVAAAYCDSGAWDTFCAAWCAWRPWHADELLSGGLTYRAAAGATQPCLGVQPWTLAILCRLRPDAQRLDSAIGSKRRGHCRTIMTDLVLCRSWSCTCQTWPEQSRPRARSCSTCSRAGTKLRLSLWSLLQRWCVTCPCRSPFFGASAPAVVAANCVICDLVRLLANCAIPSI